VRLPGGAAFFPLVIGKLFDLSAVIAHDEDFAVRLRCANQHDFVFETHAAAAKQETLSIGRPSQVSVDSVHVGELLQARAVWVDDKDVKIGFVPADESDEVSARRPDGKVVPLVSQNRDGATVEIHDAQAVGIEAGGAVDDVSAVGRERCEGIVAVARSDEVEAGAIGVHDTHLHCTIDGIDGFLTSS
jgi:hypothetical protein